MRALILCLIAPFLQAPLPAHAPTGIYGQAPEADLVRQVVKELSDARFRPHVWAKEIRRLRTHMDGKLWRLPGRTPLRTEEGTVAMDDAIAFLETQKPIGPLRFNAGLGQVAADLAADQAGTGDTGHKDAKGRSLFARLQARGSINGTAGEAISYGPSEAHEIALLLIIDDGVADRGHRLNIFNPLYHQAGAAVSTHPEWGTVCVIDFADGFVPLKP